jgi:protease-4
MKNISDNLSALIYLKNKLNKWKNITIFLLVICLMLLFRVLFGDSLIGVVEGNYIANIKIEGEILADDYRSEILEKIVLDHNIKAVIFDINSPGGEIVASEILYSEIRAIAQIKPTIILVGSAAASGAYMAAIGADHIIAHNSSIIGSIGVLMQSFEVTELAKKVGVKLQNYKSSPLKATPSPFEKSSKLSDEALQDSINDSYQFFTDLVYSRRKDKLDKNKLQMIVDGRVFTGRQALKLGLIDEIGSKGNALIYLKNFYKIAIEKLPVRTVEIRKTENKFFNKFLGLTAFYNQSKSNHQLMAIMQN